MLQNIFLLITVSILVTSGISSQVLLDPDQKLLDDYKWIYNTNIKHACKSAAKDSDEKLVIETPIDKCQFINEFTMYPNPAAEVVQLSFTATERPTIIYIADMKGQLLESFNLDNFDGNYASDIRLSGYSDGIYVITIRQEDETFIRKLLVKK